MKKRRLVLAATIAALSSMAIAQGTTPNGHSSHIASAKAPESDATAAFREANARMHRDMDIVFTNDADADFVRSMIPHHEGAIDMAKVALKYAKDEQTVVWAAAIIREQEAEIAQMREWLKKRGL